jgi:hypothetical protein
LPTLHRRLINQEEEASNYALRLLQAVGRFYSRAGLQLTKRREAASIQSGCGFLSQALQRQTHRVIKVGGSEVGAAELQLGDEAREEYAALLYRQAVGDRPDSSKLRIRQSQHAAIVLRSDVNFLTDRAAGAASGH